MNRRILVTGSSGLTGTAVCRTIEASGVAVECFDLKAVGPGHGGVPELEGLARALDGCEQVVPLAAFSRVVWCERDPDACAQTNIECVRDLPRAATALPARPWVAQ